MLLRIQASEHGGAGLLLGGIDIAPDGQDALAIELRPLPGNAAGGLGVNLARIGGAKAELALDLGALPADRFTTMVLPLPGPGPWRLEQIQIQGRDWGPGAKPLHLAIARIGSVRR